MITRRAVAACSAISDPLKTLFRNCRTRASKVALPGKLHIGFDRAGMPLRPLLLVSPRVMPGTESKRI